MLIWHLWIHPSSKDILLGNGWTQKEDLGDKLIKL